MMILGYLHAKHARTVYLAGRETTHSDKENVCGQSRSPRNSDNEAGTHTNQGPNTMRNPLQAYAPWIETE